MKSFQPNAKQKQFFSHPHEHETYSDHLLMKQLFKEVAGNVIEVQAIGKKQLSKMLYIMYLGDFISCYLAILRKIDPTPVDAITELKSILAKI